MFGLLYGNHGKKLRNVKNVANNDVCPICSEDHNKIEQHFKYHSRAITTTGGQAASWGRYKAKIELVCLFLSCLLFHSTRPSVYPYVII